MWSRRPYRTPRHADERASRRKIGGKMTRRARTTSKAPGSRSPLLRRPDKPSRRHKPSHARAPPPPTPRGGMRILNAGVAENAPHLCPNEHRRESESNDPPLIPGPLAVFPVPPRPPPLVALPRALVRVTGSVLEIFTEERGHTLHEERRPRLHPAQHPAAQRAKLRGRAGAPLRLCGERLGAGRFTRARAPRGQRGG